MNSFLSIITSDVAILIYLTLACFGILFLIIRLTKKVNKLKTQDEMSKIKNLEDHLSMSITNEKRGNN